MSRDTTLISLQYSTPNLSTSSSLDQLLCLKTEEHKHRLDDVAKDITQSAYLGLWDVVYGIMVIRQQFVTIPLSGWVVVFEWSSSSIGASTASFRPGFRYLVPGG